MSKEIQSRMILDRVHTHVLREICYEEMNEIENFEEVIYFFEHYIYSFLHREEWDKSLRKTYSQAKIITGPKMLRRLRQVILMNKITESLDYRLSQFFLNTKWKNKANLINIDISKEELHSAIKKNNQVQSRLRQVELICETLHLFFVVPKMQMSVLMMTPIKVAANMVRARDLLDTLKRSQKVSLEMKDTTKFIETFRTKLKVT